MAKLIILKIGDGNFEEGFSVNLQIGEDASPPYFQAIGKLPPNLELLKKYQSWIQAYQNLGFSFRSLEKRIQLNTSIIGIQDFFNLSNDLKYSLNNWLNSQDFRSIKEGFLTNLSRSEEIRVLIQVEVIYLRRLPWHLWDIFDYYRKAEVALSELSYGKVDRSGWHIPSDKVRILAFLGDSTEIDIQKDRDILENLANAEIKFLVEPSRREVDEFLWDECGWDILYFAGHSSTKLNGKTGQIYINQKDSLTINELKNSLRTAIDRGLQIAIFNSCDGLGLAKNLADLNIPQVIVMREPVPDIVAQEFLKQFLNIFSSGKSLYLSVREAREKLQGLENEFPCASWLPVLFQNPAELPPTWQDLCPISFATQIQAKEEYLLLSLKGVEAWNRWRERNPNVIPELVNIDLSGIDLYKANFSGVNLSGANLSKTILSRANLTGANLTGANLKMAQALNTNFEQSLLTGACIDDWNINSTTNLNRVICSYIYLKDNQQDRVPHDPNKIFAPGEFSKRYKKILETVNLYFGDGIDWQVFLASFQQLQEEEKLKIKDGSERALSIIKALENTGDGSFIIEVEVSPDIDKGEYEKSFWRKYQPMLEAAEEKYRILLDSKEAQINDFRQHNTHLMRIIELQANQTINIYNAQSGKIQKGNFNNNNIGIGHISGDNVKVAGVIHEAPKQSLAEAAADIQQLLEQLKKIYPTETTSEQMQVAAKAIEKIENNPTLKERVISALKASGNEAFKEMIDHPLNRLLVGAIEGWIDEE